MATTLEELVVKIQGDVADLKSKFEEASEHVKHHTESMSDAIESFTSTASHHFLDFGHVAETALGVFGGELLMEGVHMMGEALEKLFDTIKEGIQAAAQEEAQFNRLGIAMGAAGHYSAEAAGEMAEFAEALQHQSSFTKTSIESASALIETLGKLDQEGLQRATKASVNLAAALGIDLNSAAMLVGKAAEGNVTTLTRYGLAVEQGATKTETFANAMRAIEGLGDTAAGQLNTFRGATTQLSFGFEDLQKAFGETIVKNAAVIDTFKEAGRILNDMTEYVKQNQTQIKLLVADGLVLAISATQVFVDTLNVLWRMGKIVFADLDAAANLLDATFKAVGQSLRGHFSDAFETLKKGAKDAGKEIDEAQNGPTGLSMMSKKLEQMGVAAAGGFLKIQSGAAQGETHIRNLHQAADESKKTISELAKEGEKLAKSFAYNPEKDYRDQLKHLKTSLDSKKITTDQYANEELNALQKKTSQENAALEAAHNEGLINDAQYYAARAKLAESYAQQEQDLQARHEQLEKAIREAKIQSTSQMFGNLASLQRSGNATLFEIGKQAAVAQAIVDGAAAAVKTQALWGWPLAIPFLAAQAVATGVQIATIEGQHLATGIDEVPGIGARDNFPAVLAPGERVVPAQTNQDLTQFLKGQGGQSGLLASIKDELSQMRKLIAQGTTIEIDGKAVFRAVNNQYRLGRSFG